MIRSVLALAVAGAALLVAPATGAGGPQKPLFRPSDCTYDKTSNTLTCSRRLSSPAEPWTEILYVADASCASGSRAFERSGTGQWSWTTESVFSGRKPRPEYEIVGNEYDFTFEWLSYTDTDLGCTA